MDTSIGGDNGMGPDQRASGCAFAFSAGDRLDQYEVVRVLGAGGMGEVYEVEHTALHKRYALKLLPSTLDWREAAPGWFQQEARGMASLEHLNILQVDAFGDVEGRYWLRMELAEDLPLHEDEDNDDTVVTLQDLADTSNGKVRQEIFLPILREVLQGLVYAHQQGAIHGDLKPSNILLFPAADSHRNRSAFLSKISDYGLVRLIGEDWVHGQVDLALQRSMSMGSMATRVAGDVEGMRTSALLETHEYMSPEQKRGEGATAQSDLYAVGLMSFRLLAGCKLARKPVSQVNGRLVTAWDAFVREALKEDAAERLPSAKEGLRLLKQVEEDVAYAVLHTDEEAERLQQELEHKESVEARKAARLQRRQEHRQQVQEARKLQAEARAEKLEGSDPVSGDPVPVKRGQRIQWVGLALVFLMVGVAMWRGRSTEELVEPRRVDLGGGVMLDLVWIPAGTFVMGSPKDEPYRDEAESQHNVKLSRGYWLGQYEVTQEQWELVMGSNPSLFKGPKKPVDSVSWDDCQRFITKLNHLVPGENFRLPTEAEWEYACRAGTRGAYAGNLDDIGWYEENSEYRTHPVGAKKPNAWGLHDMHGNVMEWCQDWFGEYPSKMVTDPAGSGFGTVRIFRGGSWVYEAGYCRSALRGRLPPSYRYIFLGFRLASTAAP